MSKGGYLSLELSGLDVHLPPVKMRRLKAKQITLPTATEWIADMMCYAADPEWLTRMETRMTSKTMRPFNTFLKMVKGEDSDAGKLAARLYADPTFPERVYYKQRVQGYMRDKGGTDREIALLDALWERYLEAKLMRQKTALPKAA